MRVACLALLLLSPPFWETKSPRDWTDDELAQISASGSFGEAPAVTGYLATAKPMREAETELRRRSRSEGQDDDDFAEFLKENEGKVLVLAIALPKGTPLNEADVKKIEDKSFLVVGKRRQKLLGHFAPTPADPRLRLVFPRDVSASDVEFRFELYLPVTGPYRQAQFRVSDLGCRGKAEF